MTVCDLAGIQACAQLGLSRVVLARELPREELETLCAQSPLPLEVFVHGALCQCYSGQCAFSAVVGERSGNRGLCAQPCRLPYRLDGGRTGHPLSLKDACLADHLAELADMGVSILKLEGRMKRPEYVAVITRIYAALLKENRRPAAEELRQLELAFSRDGFTDGYWQGKTGPDMFGTRRENAPDPEELFRSAKAAYDREDMRTVPVTLSAEIQAGRPARLMVRDRDGNGSLIQGAVPEAARTRPLEAEDVKARLAKTGGTVFRAEEVEVALDPGLSLPASGINALRRDALNALAALRTLPPRRRECPASPLPEAPAGPGEPRFTVSLFRGEQLTEELVGLSPAIVYLPAEIGRAHV